MATATKIQSFRSRAEAAARAWRESAGLPAGRHQHWLHPSDGKQGRNFLHPSAWPQVQARHSQGKGVGLERTTTNLLASQAMAFNVFAPLVPGVTGGLPADAVFSRCWPGLARVECIRFEYTPGQNTPESDPFGDQSAQGGVDADLRIDFRHRDGARGVLLVETKFVETGFSGCAYRGRSRTRCPDETVVSADGGNCCYSTRKHRPFRYWQQAIALDVLDMAKVRSSNCPFGGGLWQPWLNLTLSKAIAAAESLRNPGDPVRHAWYSIVAPAGNTELHAGTRPDAVTALRPFVKDPDAISLVQLEKIIAAIGDTADTSPTSTTWISGLRARYAIA